MSMPLTRREALKQLAVAGVSLPLLGAGASLGAAEGSPSASAGKAGFRLGVAS